jgi:hypothetical protein
MNNIEEFDSSKSYIITVNPDLDKYDVMPLFQEKKDNVAAVLAKHPIPQEWVKATKDGRIKRYFEQKMSVEQIAQRVSLPQADVLLALEEMGLIEPVIA